MALLVWYPQLPRRVPKVPLMISDKVPISKDFQDTIGQSPEELGGNSVLILM